MVIQTLQFLFIALTILAAFQAMNGHLYQVLSDVKQSVILKENGVCIAIHTLWCTLHFINMLILVEPCHRTSTEMQITQSAILSTGQ
ncbi:unnamed protein product, partial [Iphiclides podalirius]